MITHYITLGVAVDATDDEIRSRYLKLVKQHTPETDPVRFQKINEAYESLKTKRRRIRAQLFIDFKPADYRERLFELAETVTVKRKRAGIRELYQSQKT